MNSFSVVFNSKFGDGAENNNKTYHFDWGIFEDCLYEVETRLVIETMAYGASPTYQYKLPLLYCDFGSQVRTYTTGATNSAIKPSLTLIAPIGFDYGNNYLRGVSKDNCPLLVMRRPNNQNPNVLILDNDGLPYVPPTGSFGSAVVPDYILIFSFKKVAP